MMTGLQRLLCDLTFFSCLALINATTNQNSGLVLESDIKLTWNQELHLINHVWAMIYGVHNKNDFYSIGIGVGKGGVWGTDS